MFARDVLFGIAASNGEHQDDVAASDVAAAQPVREDGSQAIVVDARSQLGDIVCRRVGLDGADLAEVVDRVASMAGTSAHSEDKEPSTAGARVGEHIDHLVNLRLVDAAGYLGDLLDNRFWCNR